MIVDCAPRGWLRLIEGENFKGDQLPLREARFPIERVVLSMSETPSLETQSFEVFGPRL
nr:hypothetical protein [Rhizobium mongolense]